MSLMSVADITSVGYKGKGSATPVQLRFDLMEPDPFISLYPVVGKGI